MNWVKLAYGPRNSSGSLEKFAAMRRASSLPRKLLDESVGGEPASPFKHHYSPQLVGVLLDIFLVAHQQLPASYSALLGDLARARFCA